MCVQKFFHTMNIGVLVLVLPHSTHNFHGNHTLILFPNVLQIVICSVCSQMQLLGTLITFTLLWQKAFLTWSCQTHCRLQKQVHKMVIMNFSVDSLAWVPNIHLSPVYIATQSNRQTSQLHSTNITGGATTPEIPPISNQKCKLKFTNHAIKVLPLYVFWSSWKCTVVCMVSVLALLLYAWFLASSTNINFFSS